MCGVFGLVLHEATRNPEVASQLMRSLFVVSESRGKEASGLATLSDHTIHIAREARPASWLVNAPLYREMVAQVLNGDAKSSTRTNGDGTLRLLMGHTRLVTNGSAARDANNQPVFSGRTVGVHNGIIVNADELAHRHQLKRGGELDSEVLFGLLDRELEAGASIEEASRRTFASIDGAATIAAVFSHLDCLLLATNNGSLYAADANETSPVRLVFASERQLLSHALERCGQRDLEQRIRHVRAGRALVVDRLELREFDLAPSLGPTSDPQLETVGLAPPREVVNATATPTAPMVALPEPKRLSDAEIERLAETLAARRGTPKLTRCTCCILPHTMPFIEFDEDGLCNFCRQYIPIEVKGRSALEEAIAAQCDGPTPLQGHTAGRPRCLVGASGGRDSSYALHYAKQELGLDVVAYTYDWGMVTDLARRNVSRLCGRLGIEHILVSADIAAKRQNIKRNLEAWLHRPRLGLIPLFMAGDKQYFFHAQRLKKQVGTELVILGENMLERTNFKTGFAGVPPALGDRDHVYTLPGFSKARLATWYGAEYVKNPRLINRSLLDTAFAFGCYYLIDRSYLNLFGYVPWNEETVISTIRDEYDWEGADDTTSTWRIGDGTSAFYNMVYWTLAGFTEHDTFRSNQIREGQLDRTAALALVAEENLPRLRTIEDYLHTVGTGVPLGEVTEIVAQLPRRYEAA